MTFKQSPEGNKGESLVRTRGESGSRQGKDCEGLDVHGASDASLEKVKEKYQHFTIA